MSKRSQQPTQKQHAHFLCVCMCVCACVCVLWHVEFLNEQECVHKRLSSTLHLGTQHDVFVQMISLARRQPNYLSSSVSSEPKRTSTLTHTHRSVHIPQGRPSATLLPHCVMEAITLPLSAGSVELGKSHLAPRCRSCLHILMHWSLGLVVFHNSQKPKSVVDSTCFVLTHLLGDFVLIL